MRAAFHPDGRHLYVTTLTQVSERQYMIHVRTFRYDPTHCSIGSLVGTAQGGADTASSTRVYGLEVHPSGGWLYQTTASARKIYRFRVAEDRLPVPVDSYDATQGGTVPCAQLRRLEIHPGGHALYSNCNNGPGVDLTLQVWAIGPDGDLEFREHHVLETMNAGITDPVLHPSGRWLYQPVGTEDRNAPRGLGAYVLTFAVNPDGRLRFHDATAARLVTPEDSVQDLAQTQVFPMTFHLHPDGSAAYAALHVILDLKTFPHEFVRYRVENAGGKLIEAERRPAALATMYSTHHGAALVGNKRELFLYSYLTDYDTTRGGVLQQYRIGGDHQLIPLDPPFIATGLRDARQPIVPR